MDEFQIHRHWPAGLFPFGYPIRRHPSKLTLPPSSFLFISSATVLALAACSRHLELSNRPFARSTALALFPLFSTSIQCGLSKRSVWELPCSGFHCLPANSSASPLSTPPSSHAYSSPVLCSEGNCALLTVSHKVMLSLSYVHDVPLSGDISTSLG